MAGVVVWGVSGYLARLHNGVVDRGDPLLNAWIIAWDQHQIVRNPLELFDGNIFHPYRDTLAFSETILAPALLAAPARLFTANPIAVQNVSYASAFVLLGLACYFFFRWAARDEIAAGVGAVAVALSPQRYNQLGQVQLLHTAGFAILLYGLLAFVEDRRRSAAPLVAGALVFEMLTSLYLGVMAAATIGIGLAFTSLRAGREVSRRLLPWLAVAALLVVPIVLPYQRLAEELGYGGSLEDQWVNWASHKDYIRPVLGSFASRIIGPELSLPRGRSAYLGLVFSILAAGTIVSLRRGRHKGSLRERTATVLLATLAVMFFSLSLGAWRTIGGHRLLLPWYFASRLPGFSGIRAPIRFGIVVDLAVVALASIGLAQLRRRMTPRLGTAASGMLAWGIGVLAFLERAPNLPIRLVETVETPAEAPHVYHWLASDRAAVGVLELPMNVGSGEHESWDVVPYKQVYFSTIHWKRIVNGTSGYLPPGYWKLTEKIWFFPRKDVVEELRYLPINRVIVHRRLYKIPIPASTFAGEPFRILHDCPEDLVVEVKSEAPGERPDLGPVVRAISTPSSAVPFHVRVDWSATLPPLLYPPGRFRVDVRSRDSHSRETTAGLRGWLMEPRVAKVFKIVPGRSSREVTVEVATDAGETVSKSWNLESGER